MTSDRATDMAHFTESIFCYQNAKPFVTSKPDFVTPGYNNTRPITPRPVLRPSQSPLKLGIDSLSILKAALPEDKSKNYVKLPVDITLSWITAKPCDKIEIYTLLIYVVYTIEDYACLHCRVQFSGLDA